MISSVQMQRTYIVVLDPPFTSYTKVRFCIILSGENSVSIGEIILLVCILKLKLLGILAASNVVVSVRRIFPETKTLLPIGSQTA